MRVVLAAAGILCAGSAFAGPPPGQSAYLRGAHDREAASWMKTATTATACDRGWITDLQYIGVGGSPTIDCHDADVAAGISYLQRLDASGSEPIPHDPAKAASFGAGFAAAVGKCPNLHVWIVGNEPNVGWGADVETTSTANAAAYAEVHKAVHAVAGHASDLVLLAPDSPYSPACICSLHRAIQKSKARGVKPDGYAVHAYTQAQRAADLPGMTALVTSEAMSGSNDACGYPFHWQFRIYRDWIKAIEAEGEGGAPVFLTESGNACAPEAGNNCYPDQDLGYFAALWKEAADWNSTATTKIRAITPTDGRKTTTERAVISRLVRAQSCFQICRRRSTRSRAGRRLRPAARPRGIAPTTTIARERRSATSGRASARRPSRARAPRGSSVDRAPTTVFQNRAGSRR